MALTLLPSDSTKDRFISTYLIPEFSLSPTLPFPCHSDPHFPFLALQSKAKTKDLPFFNATVLELVKLLQAALSLFGMYHVKQAFSSSDAPLLLDGLLCDVTLSAIQQWIIEIGHSRAAFDVSCLFISSVIPLIFTQPSERIPDPMFISALLTFVLSIRNKIAHVHVCSSSHHLHMLPHSSHPSLFLKILFSTHKLSLWHSPLMSPLHILPWSLLIPQVTLTISPSIPQSRPPHLSTLKSPASLSTLILHNKT